MSGASLLSATDYGQLGQLWRIYRSLRPLCLSGSGGDGPLLRFDLYRDLSASWRRGHQDHHAERACSATAHHRQQTGSLTRDWPRHHSRALLADHDGRTSAITVQADGIAVGRRLQCVQTGVVDAAEGPFGSIAGAKLNETRKGHFENGHQIISRAWVAASQRFNRLPKTCRNFLRKGRQLPKSVTQMTLDTGRCLCKAARLLRRRDREPMSTFRHSSRPRRAAYEKVPNITPGIYDQCKRRWQSRRRRFERDAGGETVYTSSRSWTLLPRGAVFAGRIALRTSIGPCIDASSDCPSTIEASWKAHARRRR